jgi:hypothetical protein
VGVDGDGGASSTVVTVVVGGGGVGAGWIVTMWRPTRSARRASTVMHTRLAALTPAVERKAGFVSTVDHSGDSNTNSLEYVVIRDDGGAHDSAHHGDAATSTHTLTRMRWN